MPEPDERAPLVQNENALKDADRALRAGDEQKIADEIQAIERIGRITVSNATLICNRVTLFESIEV